LEEENTFIKIKDEGKNVKGNLLMSQKERGRKVVLENVLSGKMTLLEGGELMKVSYRQAKRILARYRAKGDKGLVHQRRGLLSNRAFSGEFKNKILKRYSEMYEGFGPTLASEKLEGDGYKIKAETLRKWLIKDGQWSKHRKRKSYRRRRERRPRFGDLLQLDGSIHEWFGVGAGHKCLMNMVDDATGTTLSLMAEGETTEGAMRLLQEWIRRYGVPKALYVDLKTLYVLPQKEKEEGIEDSLSVFGRACSKLGIKIIKAYSAQAKGRVERNHGVYQDRFVKEIRLRKLKTIEEANKLLYEDGFIEHLNKKFAKLPAEDKDGHRKLPEGLYLYDIFCWENDRTVQKDWTIRHKNKWYQIQETKPLIVRDGYKVLVKRHLDGKISIEYKNKKIAFEALKGKPEEKKKEIALQRTEQERSLISKRNSINSPWRTFNLNWLKKQRSVSVNNVVSQ